MTTLDYVSVRKTFGPTTALIGLDLSVRETVTLFASFYASYRDVFGAEKAATE